MVLSEMPGKIFRKIDGSLSEGERVALATIVNSEGSTPREEGAKMIIYENGDTFGTIGGDRAEERVKEEALKSLQKGRSHSIELELEDEEEGGVGMKCGGKMEVFIDIIEPSQKLVLIGAGKVVRAVAELGAFMGFNLVIIDPSAQVDDFPQHAKVISQPVKNGLEKIGITPRSNIAIITRHEYDEEALVEALKTDAGYVGMMGSENRVRSVFEYLEEEKGVEREELKRVHAPIGLEIGVETPREIAVSILGEIIKKRRNPEASGGSLKLNY